MSSIIVTFEEQTHDPHDRIAVADIGKLRSRAETAGETVEIQGLPENPDTAIVAWSAAWYGIKVLVSFALNHDDTWKAVTTFIADVMDGHLRDGWVKVVVNPDGSVTQTTHRGNEYPEGSIVTVSGGKTEVRAPQEGEFTRELFLKALREILSALLPRL